MSDGENNRYGIITSQTAAQEILGYGAGEIWRRLRTDGGATVHITEEQETTNRSIILSHTVDNINRTDFPVYSAELEQPMPSSEAHQFQVLLKLHAASSAPRPSSLDETT